MASLNEEEISHQNSHYRINRVCLDMTRIDTSFHLLRIIGMKSDAVSWTIGNSAKKWRSRPKKNRIIVRARACPFSTARALASALGCAPAAVGTLKHRMPWQQSLRLTGCCLLHRALTKITKSDTEGEESPGSVVTYNSTFSALGKEEPRTHSREEQPAARGSANARRSPAPAPRCP